jgi:ABC-2 type transport system ATP-binding protein
VSPRPRRPAAGPSDGATSARVAEADGAPALAVRGLVKRYGRVTAVDGLDLSLPPASVLALLGPNGAGKTTTVEVCTGFARADAGEVRVLGTDPATAPDALRARIGVMPQGGGAYPGVRAEEMLRLVAACAADPLDPAWLVDVLGLRGCARTPYKRLSGGQQQRLALACAIVGRPELVFLDEPTAGLDPQGRRLVWELVAALRRDGVAVLLTTHLMEEAEALADHVVIVDHGRVVAQGSPAALTAGGDQELRFRARPGMDVVSLATALPAGYRAAETLAGRYVVQGRIDPAVLSTITGWCAEQGALADDVQVARRSLEDVFLELTGRELRS